MIQVSYFQIQILWKNIVFQVNYDILLVFTLLKKEMIVLKRNRALFKVIGLLLDENVHSKWTIGLINIVVSFPMLAVFYLSVAYFVENISDMTETTNATYVIAAMSLLFSQYWVFAIQNSEFRSLLDELQSIVDQSIHI